MKTQLISDTAVEKATGKSWGEWFSILNDVEAAKLSHKDIVQKLCANHDVEGWWAQNITVEFERSIGRRDHGQRCDGDYEVSVSKTLAGTMDDAIGSWQEFVGDARHFNDVAFANEPSTSKTDKWRYWRVNLTDGTRLNIIISQKDAGKAQLTVQHGKVQNREDADGWKVYWKQRLPDL